MRLRRALELLIEHCDADGGHLFAVRGDQTECVASAGQMVSTTAIEEFVEAVRTADSHLGVGITANNLGLDDDVTRWSRFTSEGGIHYDPVVLHAAGDDRLTAIGIAILHPKDAALREADAHFLQALVGVLAETGDLGSAQAAPGRDLSQRG